MILRSSSKLLSGANQTCYRDNMIPKISIYYLLHLCCLCSCLVCCQSSRKTASSSGSNKPWSLLHNNNMLQSLSSFNSRCFHLVRRRDSNSTCKTLFGSRDTSTSSVSRRIITAAFTTTPNRIQRQYNQQQQQQQQQSRGASATAAAFLHPPCIYNKIPLFTVASAHSPPRSSSSSFWSLGHRRHGHGSHSTVALLLSTACAAAAAAAVVSDNHTDTSTDCESSSSSNSVASVTSAASSSPLLPRGGGQEQLQQQQQEPDALFATSPSSLSSLSSTTSNVFPSEILEHDHYNGVTIHLEKRISSSSLSSPSSATESLLHFEQTLQSSLLEWKRQGKRGIWIHCPRQEVDKIPICIRHGFQFHMVMPEPLLKQQHNDNSSTTTTTTTSNNNNMLVLSQWLPSNQTLMGAATTDTNNIDKLNNDSTTTRLPPGPMYQVGVGCFVLHPNDPTKMLVVQERTGPAATYKLWKMPTGLVDAHDDEDIHNAAIRELYEETGLHATFQGIVLFRQAHAMGRRSGIRGTSDLFFVCLLKLNEDNDNKNDNYDDIMSMAKLCPNEIADIRWMSIHEYAQQPLWLKSPLYQELNRALINVSLHALFTNTTLPLGRLLRSPIPPPPSQTTTASDSLREKDKVTQQPPLDPATPVITNTIYKSQL